MIKLFRMFFINTFRYSFYHIDSSILKLTRELYINRKELLFFIFN